VLLHLAARGRILHQRAAHRVAEDHARVLAALGDGGGLAAALTLLADIAGDGSRARLPG
jgi:hypothetical protein